jgi:hypothetical protein
MPGVGPRNFDGDAAYGKAPPQLQVGADENGSRSQDVQHPAAQAAECVRGRCRGRSRGQWEPGAEQRHEGPQAKQRRQFANSGGSCQSH